VSFETRFSRRVEQPATQQSGNKDHDILIESSPKYSIIVVNYNGGNQILACLESVFQHTSNFEVILVDNNSTDQSAALAIRRFSQIMLLKNERNLGFAAANNVGMKKARGAWIVLLNPDTVVTVNWLEELSKCGASSKIGIIGPKLLRLDRRTIDSVGLNFNFKTGLSFDRGSGEIDIGQFDKVEPVPCFSFACAAIKREVILATGLLDERMVLYFDDIDYCIRARIAGWRVLYCPNALVLHARGGVTPKSSRRLQRQAVAYRLRIMLKCYSRRNAIKYGLLRIGNDMISTVAGLKNNDFEYFRGFLRSPLWNLLNIPLVERRQVQSSRKVSDEDLFHP
jgi:GT2 family glycosyltransferase